MKNMKTYMQDMINDGWQFHFPYDESMKHCPWGDKGNYKAYLNLKSGRIELWYLDKEWVIEPPEIYSFAELEDNAMRCDCCGEIQISVDDLTLINEINKYCKKCKK